MNAFDNEYYCLGSTVECTCCAWACGRLPTPRPATKAAPRQDISWCCSLDNFLPNKSAVSCMTKSLAETPPSTLRQGKNQTHTHRPLKYYATRFSVIPSGKHTPIMHWRYNLSCIRRDGYTVRNGCYTQFPGRRPHLPIRYCSVSYQWLR